MIVRERVASGSSPGALAPPGPGRSAWDRLDPALAPVLLVLPLAGLAELLLVRTFYRVGIYLPKEGAFRTVYAALTSLGSFALDLSSVLAFVALGLLAARAWRSRRANAAAAIAAFLGSWALVRAAGVGSLGPVARLAFALAVVAVVVPFLRGRADPLHRALVGVVGVCFLLSSYSGLAAAGARFTGAPGGGGVGAQLAAEWLVVVAGAVALAAWVATDRLRPGPVVMAAPLSATLLAAWWANGAVTGILVLWTVGLRLFLPIWLYAVALWAFTAAALGWRRRSPHRSAGLVLLLVAGLLLGSTYAQALGLIALALLSDGFAVGGLPSRRRR